MPTPPIPAAQSASLAALTAKLPAGDGHALADGEAASAASFAAHFQRIAAKQVDIGLTTLSPEEPAESDESTGQDLMALLPILDTLGLAQPHSPASVPALPNAELHPLPSSTADSGAAALAAPATPPSSAANSAAATDAPAAVTSPLQAELRDPAVSVTPDHLIPARTEAAHVPSTGREFASSLTSAITTSHETQSPINTAAVVQHVVTHQSPAQSSTAHENLIVARPVGTPGWSDEVGNRIAWIAGQGRSQAELVLNPPQMGRIEVNLTLNGDQATASFASSNPVVRELLEAALPRLREVLADAGIQLGQAQVSAEHRQHQAWQEKHGENPVSDLMHITDANAAISSAGSGNSSTLAALKSGRGLVDVFA
ncbi:MAG: flagellar hook-length control protein FliK [Rhodocyclaceae bacterium]